MQPKTPLFTSGSQHPPRFGHAVYLGEWCHVIIDMEFIRWMKMVLVLISWRLFVLFEGHQILVKMLDFDLILNIPVML